MPQFTDSAGNVWEATGPDDPNPRFVRGPQGGGAVFIPNPTAQYEGPKAAADLANAQSTLADRQADNARADRLAEIQDRALRIKEEKAAQERADVEKKKLRETDQKRGKADEVRYALRQLQEAREISGRALSTGIASEYVKGIPGLGQAKVDLEKALATPFAQIMQTKMAELAQANDGGVSRLGDTPAEVERMAAAVANLGTDQSAEQLLEQIDRAENYFLGIAAQYEGQDSITPDLRRDYLPEARLNERNPDRLRGLSPSAGPAMQQADETYSTTQDIALAKRMQQVYNGGGSVKDMAKVARDAGYPVQLQQMQEWARAIDYRDATGEYEGQRTGFATVNTPESGRRSLAGQIYGDVARSDLGGMGIAAGIGAANAATLGGIDEITGAINSIGGGSMDDEIAYANLGKQAAFDAAPGSALLGELAGGVGLGAGVGKAFPKALEILSGTTKRAMATGAGIGTTTGALEFNDNRAMGAAGGAAMGAGGGLFGAKVAAPLAELAMRSRPAQAVSGAVRAGINKVSPDSVASSAVVPQFAKGERALAGNGLDGAINNLREARRLRVPYALADASPELRSLAGSVSRKSTDAGALAEQIFEPRARGQADRLVNQIDERLAPITDISERSADITKAGGIAADPYYQRAYAQPAPDDPVLNSILNTGTGKKSLRKAYGLANDARRDPAELGFVFDESTGGVSLNQAGRYSKVSTPNERGELSRTEIRGNNGRSVPKVGPIDLAGWVRSRGGLQDSGGELKAMGLTNAPRRGMDFIGREAEIGPLVSDQGMNFDDAAQAAFDAGYFPERTTRPSVNEFLDAFRNTQDGVNRRFLPDDALEIDRFNATRDERWQAREAGGFVSDNSQPAGPREFAPAEAYGKEVGFPTYETMHFARQGMDDVIDKYKNPFGELTLDNQGRAVVGLRKDFANRLGELNPDFAEGNAVYSRFAKRRDALNQGFDTLPRNEVPYRDFDRAVGKAKAYDDDFTQEGDRLLPEMQRGYATRMADIANKARYTANPFEQVYGSPNQQQKIGALFPDGSEDFGKVYGLERDMAKTAQETLGGSPTARRYAADQQFESDIADFGSGVAADAMGGGGVFTAKNALQRASRMLGDNMKVGMGKAKADAIAPALFDTNTEKTVDYIGGLLRKMEQDRMRKATFKRRGGLFGAAAPVIALPSE